MQIERSYGGKGLEDKETKTGLYTAYRAEFSRRDYCGCAYFVLADFFCDTGMDTPF